MILSWYCHSCLVMQESEHGEKKREDCRDISEIQQQERENWLMLHIIFSQAKDGKRKCEQEIDQRREIAGMSGRREIRTLTSLDSQHVFVSKKLPLLGVSVIIFLTSGTSTDSWRGILAPEDDVEDTSWNFITLFLDLWWAEEEEDPLAFPSMT